ncbi:MAG: TIGR03546 family protein [Bdellovibrionales bacterium]|nr:TIGR03546 family protein [Bdellovibrionales bacterium]
MSLILKQIFQFLKLLNSDTATNQIAAGIAMGFILGMTPALSLQTLFVFACIFLFRIQMGAAFLTAFFFKFAAFLLDPIFDSVGAIVLSAESLKPLFTTLYNMPIIPFTRFNNSIVMGSGVVSILLSPFVFILAKFLVTKYREKVVAKFKESKFWKAVKATSFYKWYYKYDELYG